MTAMTVKDETINLNHQKTKINDATAKGSNDYQFGLKAIKLL